MSEGGVGVLRTKDGEVGLVSERVGRRTEETPLVFPVVSARRALGGWLFPLSLLFQRDVPVLVWRSGEKEKRVGEVGGESGGFSPCGRLARRRSRVPKFFV